MENTQTAGRPTKLNPDLEDKICNLIASGKTLSQIEKIAGMPSARSVHRWVRKDEKFCRKYALAKHEQIESMMEIIINLADTTEGKEDSYARRLQIDARKFYLMKVCPKIHLETASRARQAQEMINKYLSGSLDLERAHGFLKLIGAEAQFKTMECYEKELKDLREIVNHLKKSGT